MRGVGVAAVTWFETCGAHNGDVKKTNKKWPARVTSRNWPLKAGGRTHLSTSNTLSPGV